MAGFCLTGEAVNRFRVGLKSGAIDPERLSNMTSDDRRIFFEHYVGKPNAKDVNALFESKLLLKNQQRGMITWAKQIAGLNTRVKTDMISRISRLNKVLDPSERQQFLKDLAATKLGVDVTQEEAKTIANLSKSVEESRQGERSTVQDTINKNWKPNEADLKFGHAQVELSNYVNKLKSSAASLGLKQLKHPGAVLSHVASNSKAINASMDNSAIFRQGWKTLWTHPGIWQRNAKQSFANLVRQFGGKQVTDETNAYIYAHPLYEAAQQAKLAVGTLEEAFPTTLPEKVPLLGRAYKASEATYTAFVHKTRMDVFAKYYQIAQKSGVNLKDPEELKFIGKLVNSLTGRGSLGKLEPVGNVVNNIFFSPRFLKSNFDTLTLHAGDKMSAFARKQAALNLVKIVSGTAAILTIANAVRPGSVEWDPRSSDFGKIKVGNTRFDVTGGMASLAVLAAKLASQSSKSSTTGAITTLNSGKYGSQTEMDVVTNFIENKLSPVSGVIRDILKGQDPSGKKTTLGGEATHLLTPIGVQNYLQMKNDPHAANSLLTAIIDGLGISGNTFSAGSSGSSDWTQNPSKELIQFKLKVGSNTFNQANKQYQNRLNVWLSGVSNDSRYKNMNPSDQASLLTTKKEKIKAQLFKEYGFKYKRSKANPAIKQLVK